VKRNRWRTIALLAVATLLATACGECTTAPRTPPPNAASLNLMATILPMKNLTLAVAEGVSGVQVRQLVPVAAGCAHDYQLEPGDMKALEHAKALVAVGAGYEPWLDKLAENYRGQLTIIRLDKNVERIPGDAEPHPFASPKQAATMARTLGDALAALDPPHAATYRDNAARTAAALLAIDAELRQAVQALPNKRVVLATTTLSYFARDAGLTTGPALTDDEHHSFSAGEVAAIMRRLKAEKPAAILADKQVDPRTPRMFAEEIGAPTITVEIGLTGAAGPQAFVETLRKLAQDVVAGLKGNAA